MKLTANGFGCARCGHGRSLHLGECMVCRCRAGRWAWRWQRWENAVIIVGIVVGCIAWAMFWAFVMRPVMTR